MKKKFTKKDLKDCAVWIWEILEHKTRPVRGRDIIDDWVDGWIESWIKNKKK